MVPFKPRLQDPGTSATCPSCLVTFGTSAKLPVWKIRRSLMMSKFSCHATTGNRLQDHPSCGTIVGHLSLNVHFEAIPLAQKAALNPTSFKANPQSLCINQPTQGTEPQKNTTGTIAVFVIGSLVEATGWG